MKLKLTIEVTYSIPDRDVAATYGTTDPAECAAIDEENIRNNPYLLAEFLTLSSEHTAKVESA